MSILCRILRRHFYVILGGAVRVCKFCDRDLVARHELNVDIARRVRELTSRR